MKMLSRPDGFLMYGKLGVDFFSTSYLLYPNMKIRLRLIRARPNFYMISENPNLSLGIADCWLYTRCIARKDNYHKLTCAVQIFETLAKTFIIRARKKTVHSNKNTFNNAPVQRIAIAMNTDSAFTRSCTQNPFWYQQFDLKQIRMLGGGQPIVDFDAADICWFFVTTMKAMNFQDDISSIPIDIFKDHYGLVFDFTSLQHTNENCNYPELVGEPLSLELNFIFPLEHIAANILLG